MFSWLRQAMVERNTLEAAKLKVLRELVEIRRSTGLDEAVLITIVEFANIPRHDIDDKSRVFTTMERVKILSDRYCAIALKGEKKGA